MVVAGRASDFKSLLSSKKVSVLVTQRAKSSTLDGIHDFMTLDRDY